MDFNNNEHSIRGNKDPERPPQYCTCNLGCGCRGQVLNGDDKDIEAHTRQQKTQELLDGIVQDQLLNTGRPIIADDDEISLPDGDEGLDDHLRTSHIDAADLGHHRVGEVKRLIAHHYHQNCTCPICPHRMAYVNDWLVNAALADAETPESMYPEQGSGDSSMMSSMFLETRPQTPSQFLAEMGSWPMEVGRFEEDGYVTNPLWLVPERMVPHQLGGIPEESEEGSED